MNLTPKQLLNKFPILKKFENQKWIEESAISSDCNFNEIPIRCAFELIKELRDYVTRTKFNSNWEFCFSMKVRLEQIESLLKFFCEDSLERKVLRGEVKQLPPIEPEPKPKKEYKAKLLSHPRKSQNI